MYIQEPIMGVENFKFTAFSAVPRADQETPYILYKEEDKSGQILIITAQHPALSSKVKAGHYNRKMTVSLAPRKMSINRQIEDISGSYRFLISVDLSYRLKNIAYIFEKELWNIDAEVKKQWKGLIESAHKKYEIEDEIELQNILQEELSKEFEKMDYLEFIDLEVSVKVDERAKKVIDSNLDVLATTVVLQNEGDRAIAELVQRTRIESQKLDAEREIEGKKNAVREEKARGLAGLKEEMGEDYATFLAYANGEISSLEYDERIRRSRKENMTAQIDRLKQISDMDVLSGPVLEKIAMNLLGEERPEGMTVLEAIDMRDSVDEDSIEEGRVIVEDTKRY